MRTKLMISALLVVCPAPVRSATGATRPDLTLRYVVDAPSPFLVGAEFSTAAQVTNLGRARASATTTSYYLSRDELADASDTVLGDRRASRLRPRRSSFRGIRLRIALDTAPGTYWLIVCADATNRVRESNERNNCITTAFPINLLARPS